MLYQIKYTSYGSWCFPIAYGDNIAEMRRLCEGLVSHADFQDGESAAVFSADLTLVKCLYTKVNGKAVLRGVDNMLVKMEE